MATTKDRLEELSQARQELDDREIVAFQEAWAASPVESRPAAASDAPTDAVPRKPLGVRLLEPITGRWAAIGSVAWLVLLAVGIAVEPPPTNPNAVDPWFVSALGTILLLALGSTLVGFWLRRRWGLAASLVASGLLVLSTIMCPVSGHHTGVGAWWVVQLGCGLGLVAASSLGLQRAQPR
jgi:peptidoglycan/LPS O-acetylase OafA/YrhL